MMMHQEATRLSLTITSAFYLCIGIRLCVCFDIVIGFKTGSICVLILMNSSSYTIYIEVYDWDIIMTILSSCLSCIG